eukprot:g2365.t1
MSAFSPECLSLSFVLLVLLFLAPFLAGDSSTCTKNPTVFVGVLVKDAEITLPTFFNFLERLDYPKHRMEIHIVLSGDSTDRSESVLSEWISRARVVYAPASRITKTKPSDEIPNEEVACANRPHCWSDSRLKVISRDRELSLRAAKASARDYYFTLDTDVFLTEPSTLRDLIEIGASIVAPMVHVFENDFGSNFWSAVDNRGYYRRGASYLPILRYRTRGIFPVSAVHSAVLVDMNRVSHDHLTYIPSAEDSALPDDDIVVFSSTARLRGVEQLVTNEKFYGVMMDPVAVSRSYVDESAAFDRLRRLYLRSSPAAYLTNVILPIVYEYASTSSSGAATFEAAFDVTDAWSARAYTDAYVAMCSRAFVATSARDSIVSDSNDENERPRVVDILYRDPQVLRLRDFLREDEMNALMTHALPKLSPSVVFNKTTGTMEEAIYRSSQVAWLSGEEHPVVADIAKRVAKWTGLNLTLSEDLQVQRYDTDGGKYEPHVDYSEWKFPGYWSAARGNRLASMIMYLNDGYEGGATVFTRLGVKIEPRRGDAVFWYNLLPGGVGDFRTKHAGCPSSSGSGAREKWIANVWIREGGNRGVYGLWGGAIGKLQKRFE